MLYFNGGFVFYTAYYAQRYSDLVAAGLNGEASLL